MAESMVVVSKVKQMVKAGGLRTGGDYIDRLSQKVEELVKESIGKVTGTSRKTLGAEDL